MSIQEIIDWNELDRSAKKRLIERPNVAIDDRIRATVETILDKVGTSGDQAIKQLTLEYDGVSIDQLKMNVIEI